MFKNFSLGDKVTGCGLFLLAFALASPGLIDKSATASETRPFCAPTVEEVGVAHFRCNGDDFTNAVNYVLREHPNWEIAAMTADWLMPIGFFVGFRVKGLYEAFGLTSK